MCCRQNIDLFQRMDFRTDRNKYLEDYQPQIDPATGKLMQVYAGMYYSWNLSDEDSRRRKHIYFFAPVLIFALAFVPGCFSSELTYFWLIEVLYAGVCVMSFAEIWLVFSFIRTDADIKRKAFEKTIPRADYLCMIIGVTAVFTSGACVFTILRYPVLLENKKNLIYPVFEFAAGILSIWFWRIQHSYRMKITAKA